MKKKQNVRKEKKSSSVALLKRKTSEVNICLSNCCDDCRLQRAEGGLSLPLKWACVRAGQLVTGLSPSVNQCWPCQNPRLKPKADPNTNTNPDPNSKPNPNPNQNPNPNPDLKPKPGECCNDCALVLKARKKKHEFFLHKTVCLSVYLSVLWVWPSSHVPSVGAKLNWVWLRNERLLGRKEVVREARRMLWRFR